VVFVFEQWKIELAFEAFAPHFADFFLIHGGYRRWDKKRR